MARGFESKDVEFQQDEANRSSTTGRALTARGESPAAFGRRCIPAGCVAPRSNIPDILTRRALPAGRIAALDATPDFHHGLLTPAERDLEAKRRGLELVLSKVRAGRAAATNPRHREMLDEAIHALDEQLRSQ